MNIKVRKRAVISFVITVIFLLLANKWYFYYKSIPVEFDTRVSDDIKGKIEIQINKHDNTDFTSYKSVSDEIQITKVPTHHSYDVKRVKKAKRLRFLFSEMPQNKPIKIQNLKIRNAVLAPENFSAEDADLTLKDNSLVIIPSKNNFILNYNEPLQFKIKPKFEWTLFVIIFVLTFLLTYKLTDYVADFKSIQNKSRIDIIFLLIFFICLFVPMSKISQDTFSEEENRNLAEWKPLIVSPYELNYSFGKDFESYFSDRFYMRKYVISFYRKLKIGISNKLSEHNNIWYNKKTGWAFMKSWIEVPDITPEMPKYIKSIKKLSDFCQKNNIKLYLVIAPVKEEIYSQEIEPFKVMQENGKVFEKEINKNFGDITYFPIDELKQASKTNYVYPKTDPHWTEEGGYLACNNFLKRYGFIPFSDNDFNITERVLPIITDIPDWIGDDYSGYYYKTLGLVNKDNYKHYEYKYESDLKHILKQPDVRLYSKDTVFLRAKNPQKVYIIGDSYTENYYRFIRFAFKNVIKRRVNNALQDNSSFNLYKYEILEEKPDILIFVYNTLNFKRFLTLWDE